MKRRVNYHHLCLDLLYLAGGIHFLATLLDCLHNALEPQVGFIKPLAIRVIDRSALDELL
jgi:hypothetical protein